jgi:hypothetical protein
MSEAWPTTSTRNPAVFKSGTIPIHELRVDRDGMLVYCPCGWAYTFSYVPAGEDISFAYRAHLEGL